MQVAVRHAAALLGRVSVCMRTGTSAPSARCTKESFRSCGGSARNARQEKSHRMRACAAVRSARRTKKTFVYAHAYCARRGTAAYVEEDVFSVHIACVERRSLSGRRVACLATKLTATTMFAYARAALGRAETWCEAYSARRPQCWKWSRNIRILVSAFLLFAFLIL